MVHRLALFGITCAIASASIAGDVRRAADLATAEKLAVEYRQSHGVTPEYLEAWSWLGRRALAAKDLTAAERYASETYDMAQQALKTRSLDAEKSLPVALGAAIEVRAQAAVARGERDQAVTFLREELAKYRSTSISARLNKNLNLLTLEGKAAPALERVEWVGARPLPLEAYRGRPALLFFWAHWCSDCKEQVPVLAKLKREFPQLEIIGVTKRYGYVQGGREAAAAEETAYIGRVRQDVYGAIPNMPVALSEETFRNYGASTTPTLVLIDRNGTVRSYRPGNLSFEELVAKLKPVLAAPPAQRPRRVLRSMR